jgi:tetratricopeptide (TPR) repeat protein
MIALISMPLAAFINNFNLANQRDNYTVYDYTSNILNTLPKNSILITTGDSLIGGLSYSLAVERQRPDIIFVKEMIGYPWYIDYLAKHYPALRLPFFKGSKGTYNMSDLAAANLKTYPLFIADSYDPSLPRNYNLIPYGLLERVTLKSRPIKFNAYKQLQNQLWRSYRIDYERLVNFKNFDFEKSLAWCYANSYTKTGNFLLKYNDYAAAIQCWEKAISFYPEFPPPYKMLGWAYIKSAKNLDRVLKGLNSWEKYLEFKPEDPEIPALKQEMQRIKETIDHPFGDSKQPGVK